MQRSSDDESARTRSSLLYGSNCLEFGQVNVKINTANVSSKSQSISNYLALVINDEAIQRVTQYCWAKRKPVFYLRGVTKSDFQSYMDGMRASMTHALYCNCIKA